MKRNDLESHVSIQMTLLHIEYEKRITFQTSECQGRITMKLEEQWISPRKPELKLVTVINMFLVVHKTDFLISVGGI